MTNGQIVKLLLRTDQQAMHGEGIDVTKADVVRLLEERKLLLEAVKNLAVVTDGRGACTAPQCLRSYLRLVEPYEAARTAIAFAEETAP